MNIWTETESSDELSPLCIPTD